MLLISVSVGDVVRKRSCEIPDGTPKATFKSTNIVQNLEKGINLIRTQVKEIFSTFKIYPFFFFSLV